MRIHVSGNCPFLIGRDEALARPVMLIRDATREDINGLVMLGEQMFQESQFARYDFDRQKVTNTIHDLIEDSNGIALVAEDQGELLAGFVGQISEHWFGKCRVSFDMAFFIAPKARGTLLAARLVKAYIRRARAGGAQEVLVGNSTGSNTEATEHFFERMGFVRVGGNFRYHEDC